MRGEFSLLQDLWPDPFVIVDQLARRSPVLGEAVQLEGAGVFGGHFSEPVRAGMSGERPARFAAECEMVASMFERVWNQRLMDEVPKTFAYSIAIQSVRLRGVMGIAPYQNDLIDLLVHRGRAERCAELGLCPRAVLGQGSSWPSSFEGVCDMRRLPTGRQVTAPDAALTWLDAVGDAYAETLRHSS